MVQPSGAQMEEEWAAEAGGASDGEDEAARALHARLVAHVRAAGGEPDGRAGVWMEHSYARAKSGAAALRVLLARAPSPADELDVEAPPRAPRLPPGDAAPAAPAPPLPAADSEPEWEARLVGAAPSAAAARAARAALGALAALRLARLASAPTPASLRREQAREAARRVRRALAPAWARGGAAWLHAALWAGPRELAALWREAAAELRRAVPRLAARLLPAPPPPPPDPLDITGRAVGAGAPGPWLAWVCAGAGDARWTRRLRALLHVRELRAAAGGGETGAPDAWCAAAAAHARAQLLDVVAEAGSRAVVVGGAGAGAALAGALLTGGAGAGAGEGAGGVRALVLLAPPLLTAEGEVTHLHRNELDLPTLVVAGSAGAACPRGAACALLAGAGPGARRVLVVRGADDALRLPARLRRRLRVPQQALDAAVVEECARWALQAADGEAGRRRARPEAPAAARGLLRDAERAAEPTRVVSRGSGATPLALPPPRRAPPAPAAPAAPAAPPAPAPLPALAAADELDIMQLPIVFADDEPAALPALPAPPAPPAPAHKRSAAATSVTVTSGHARGGRALNYTRVIVAKRRGAGGGGAARPVLLRRTVRLVHKQPRH